MPTATIRATPEGTYRRCVGIALFNRRGEILVGRRTDTPEAWQMPQGGVEPGEDVRAAALRELREEAGLPPGEVEILEIADDRPMRYDLPEEIRARVWGGMYKGQEQVWVAARLLGPDVCVDIGHHAVPEFDAWRWVPLAQATEVIVPFKREVYAAVAAMFARYATPA